MDVTPLIFNPIFKPRIWGGRRLHTVMGKSIQPDIPIGESWEIADLEDDQTVVRDGPSAGKSIGELVRTWGADLLGGAKLLDGRFPLLLKYLDTEQNLSVQVHPDQKMAQRLGGNVRVKNEAWYVLHAEPNAVIYRGLHPRVTRDSFMELVQKGQVVQAMRRIPVKPGQCFFLPSGTLHALGAGITVAEIQTPSDITYRVYDWGRSQDDPSVARPLHLSEALECIRFGDDTAPQPQRSHVASLWTSVTQLVKCDSFVIERVRMIDGVEQDIPVGDMYVWMVISGRAEIVYDRERQVMPFSGGDTVLIPAGLPHARLRTLDDCVWLEVTVPLESDLKNFPRPRPADLVTPEDRGYVQINVPRPGEPSAG